MTRIRLGFPGSLQFRLVVGFAAILTMALASLALFSAYATHNETERYAAAVEAAQAQRVERAVTNAYQTDDDWATLQLAVEQVSALFGWRVVVASPEGYVLADSNRRLWSEGVGRLDIMQPSYRRPILIDERVVGVMWVEDRPRNRLAQTIYRELEVTPTGGFSLDRGLMIVRNEAGRPPEIMSITEESAIPALAPAEVNSSTNSVDEAALAEPSLERLEGAFQDSLLWTGITAGIAGVLLVSLFTRRALAPVRTLTAAAHRIGRGDLAHRVPANSRNDEVGELSRTFNAMADGLQVAEDRRKKMTADIAHELRTPLTNIQGYLEAMRDGVVNADTDTLTTLHMQATHLSRLVDDLRLLSVAEAGALRLELNEDDIASLVNETARAFRPRADALGVEITVDLAEDLPSVCIDRGRMRQVIGNLVENALSITPKHGRIGISGRRDPQGGVAIEVQDSGRGIPPEQLDRVFEQFYRIDSSRTRSTGGAGLGLTIVKRLVEAHGGRVSVESIPGTRTAFTVRLPTSREDL